MPVARVRDAVVAGTVTATLVITAALVVAGGPERLANSVAAGLGVGLMFVLPIAAAHVVGRLRRRRPLEVRIGWPELVAWATATVLQWVIVPWALLHPHGDFAQLARFAPLPVGIHVAAVLAHAIGSRRGPARDVLRSLRRRADA